MPNICTKYKNIDTGYKEYFSMIISGSQLGEFFNNNCRIIAKTWLVFGTVKWTWG